MSTGKLQIRRGTAAELATIVPDLAEPIYTTDTKKIYIGDGVTTGGVKLSPSWGDITGTLSNQTDIQTALDGKQPIDADLTAIAGIAGTSGLLKKTGVNTWVLDTNTYLITESDTLSTVTSRDPTTNNAITVGNSITANMFKVGSLSYSTTGSVAELGGAVAGYMQAVMQNKDAGTGSSCDLVVSNNLGTDTTYYGSFGMNSSAFTGSGSFNLPNAVYLQAQTGDLVIGTGTANAIRFVTNNGTTDNATVLSTGEWGIGATPTAGAALTLPAGTATKAPLNIGAFSATKTTPVDGDIWKSAADSLAVRMSTNTRTLAFLEKAQTFSAVNTFSATPVISSTTASTTAGAVYKRTNYGLVGYEAGMAQEFISNIYTAPVGTALTNSVTETDVNGGTAVFGTRTLSTSVMQIGTVVTVRARVSFTNTAANTLTLRLRWSTISGTVLASAVITRVNTAAEPFDVVFRGVASAAPGASASTSWTCEVLGNSAVASTATCSGTIVSLATSTATPLILSAQWTSALATSSMQTLTSVINLD